MVKNEQNEMLYFQNDKNNHETFNPTKNQFNNVYNSVKSH